MRQIILVGIGHTNAHVLREWKRNPISNAKLICVSDFPMATYSGMLPEVVIGATPAAKMQIDLSRFCDIAGAELILDDVTEVDADRRTISFSNHEPLTFDAMSIGVGSVPSFGRVSPTSEGVITIKPMQKFLDKFDSAIQSLAECTAKKQFRVTVVGGGVASIELTACLPFRVSKLTNRTVRFCLVSGKKVVPPGIKPRIQNAIQKRLVQRGVELHLGKRVQKIDDRRIWLDNSQTLDSDLIVWATNAAPPELASRLGLPTDTKGFLLTDKSLLSTSGAPIFVVGDTGSIVDLDVPKSGVFAVRQGPVLWENLQRLLNDQPLVEFEPQHTFMKLVNMGDGTAFGQWRGLTMSGRWVMHLKRAIDNQFIKKYTTGL